MMNLLDTNQRLFYRVIDSLNQYLFMMNLLDTNQRLLPPIFHFHCEHVISVYIGKQKQTKNFVIFQNFQKQNFDGGKVLKIQFLFFSLLNHSEITF